MAWQAEEMSSSLKSRRFASLLRQLVDEADGRHGAKSEVARQLEMSQSYASKIMRGDRTTISDDMISRAARALDLSPDFFEANGPDDLAYVDFVGVNNEPEGWREWLRLGADATPEEQRSLRAMADAATRTGVEVTPALLSAWHMSLRMQALGATRKR